MSNYNKRVNDEADQHSIMVHERLNQSAPYANERLRALLGDDELDEVDEALKATPIKTKAINNARQERIDLVRHILTMLAVIIVAIAIYNLVGAQ